MAYGYGEPITGVVTQAATAGIINIPIPGTGDLLKFEIWDETQFGATTSDTDMLAAWWYKDMLAGSAFVQNRVSGQATAITTNMVLTNGFTQIDPNVTAALGPTLTGSAVSSAAPAVVTSTNTGTLANGNNVRVWSTTGLLQIAGIDYTVSNVSVNTNFKLAYLDTTLANLTGTASAISYAVINVPPFYLPRRYSILNVGTATAAGVQGAGTSSILTLSINHALTVGQAVRVYVPTSFVGAGPNPFISGSVPYNSFAATITAINTADASSFTNTITVSVNSTGFTFKWPTSATAAAGMQVPFVEPVGEAATSPYQNLLDDKTFNQGSTYMQLGSSVYGVASDVLRWIAWRGLVQS